MSAVRLLSKRAVNKILREAGLIDSGKKFSGASGEYEIWVTSWGEPMMVPEEGPDKRCAEWVLHERLKKVLDTNPEN